MRNASLVLAMLVVTPLVADAKPKKGKKSGADAHAAAAAKAHKDGKFDVALTELQAAYAADPQPKYLFAIAQVQAKLDNCGDAIPNYEKFLAATKDKQKRAVVKQAIDACKTKLAFAAPKPEPAPAAAKPEPSPFRERKPEEPPSAPAAVETQPPPPPVETAPPAPPPEPVAPPPAELPPATAPLPVMSGAGPARSPWYTDILGDALVLGGTAAAVVSVIMYTGARSNLDDAEDQTSLDAYQDLVDQAHDKRRISVIAAGAGAVLIGAGVLRYVMRDGGESRAVAVTPMQGGGLVTWSGGF